jgi:hypothetical protein
MGTHTFRASDDLGDRLDARCLAENINKSELIIRAIEGYLASEIQPVLQPVTQTDINDRFLALEGKIEEIKKQLGAIVESGKTPQKTAKTIATGETIVKVNWKYFISKHPGKTIDELCEIARERYPDKPLKLMRDSINRAMKR